MHSLWALILVLIGMVPLLGREARRSACPQSHGKVKVMGEESVKDRVSRVTRATSL